MDNLEFELPTPDLAIAYSSTLIAATIPIWIGSIVSGNQKAVSSSLSFSSSRQTKIRKRIVKVVKQLFNRPKIYFNVF